MEISWELFYVIFLLFVVTSPLYFALRDEKSDDTIKVYVLVEIKEDNKEANRDE